MVQSWDLKTLALYTITKHSEHDKNKQKKTEIRKTKTHRTNAVDVTLSGMVVTLTL